MLDLFTTRLLVHNPEVWRRLKAAAPTCVCGLPMELVYRPAINPELIKFEYVCYDRLHATHNEHRHGPSIRYIPWSAVEEALREP